MKMDMLEFEGEPKLTPTYNTIIMPLPSLRLIKKPGDETEDILDGRIFVVITGACNEFGRQFAMEIARILEQGSKVLLLDNDEVILYNTTMWIKKYVPADYHLVDFTIDQPQVIQEMLASYIYPKENCPSWEEIRKNHPMPPDYDRIIIIHNTTPLDHELTREYTSEVYWEKFYNLTVRAPLALNTAVRHIFNLTTDGEEAVDAIEDEKEFDVMIKKSVEAIIRSRENKEEELKVNVENEGENKAKKDEKKIDVEDKKLKKDKDDKGEKKLKGDKDDDKKMDDEKKKKDEDKKMEDERKKKDDIKNVQCRDNKENTSFFLNQCKSQKKNDNLKRTISEASCSGNSQVKTIPEKKMKLIETGEVSGTQTETKEKNTDEKMDDMETESEESNVKNNETEKKLESNDDDDEKKEEEKCEEGDVKVEEEHNVKTENGGENDGKERDDGENVDGVKTKIKQKTIAIFVNIIPVCQSVAFNNMESYCTSYVVRKMVFQKGPGMQSPKARVLNYAPGCITFPDSLFAPGEEKKGPLELKRLKPPEPQPDLNDENRRPTIVESVTELISILQENTYASGDIIDYNTNDADPVFENIEEMSIKILGEMDTS